MKRFDFHEQLRRGKIGEKVIISLLKYEYIDCDFIDVSEVEEFKRKDIDLIKVDKNTGKRETIEIKCDETNYKTWNIFAEFCSCKRLGTPGWLLKSQADYICYCFTKRGVYFLIPREVLLDMIQIYTFRIGEAYDKFKTSQGYLIPISMIEAFEKKQPQGFKDKFALAYQY